MTKVHGESCTNRGRFYKWVEHFKSDRESVSDKHQPLELPF